MGTSYFITGSKYCASRGVSGSGLNRLLQLMIQIQFIKQLNKRCLLVVLVFWPLPFSTCFTIAGARCKSYFKRQ